MCEVMPYVIYHFLINKIRIVSCEFNMLDLIILYKYKKMRLGLKLIEIYVIFNAVVIIHNTGACNTRMPTVSPFLSSL